VDFDHENYLGHSLREIAGEKAGIVKARVPLVVAPQREEAREVILARAAALGAPVVETAIAYTLEEEKGEARRVPGGRGEAGRNGGAAGADRRLRVRTREKATGWSCELRPSLQGKFQVQNAVNAVAAARLLAAHGFRQISTEAIELGIAEAVWPGRLERLQERPEIYLDGAHNPSAARELAEFWEEHFAGRRIWLVYGALRDKAVDEIAGTLFPRATEVVITEPRTSRAISARQLEEMAGHHAGAMRVMGDAEQAVEHVLAKAAPEDAIFVTGSLYLVGQIRHWWRSRVPASVR